MQKLINILKSKVSEAVSNPDFIHHKWFLKYHLTIVEQISMETCEIYKEADRDLVMILVWIHDYGKIVGVKEDIEKTLQVTKKLMQDIGFEESYISKAIDYLRIFESKIELDLNLAPIEVKITSSADGASHLVGPFYPLWFYENSDKNFEELMEGNKKKAIKDWNRKIVLPEIKNAFMNRNNFIMENYGDLPKSYIIK